MKIIHMIGGGDVGGAKTHVLSLLERLSKEEDILLVSFRDGEFSDEAKALGIKTEVIKSKNPIKDFLKLRRLVRDGGFDVVHCHGSKANVMGALIKKGIDAPVITTVHSDYRLDYLGSFIKRCTFGIMNTVALRFLDAYIGVTKAFADILIERNFDPYKLHTLSNGIDFNRPLAPSKTRAEYLAEQGIEENENTTVCGIAARFHPVKDIATAICAMEKIKDTCPDMRLLIGGDGEQEEYLKALVAEKGLSESVKFVGWINDMDTFLNAVDISVISSLSEGFPYSILESARAKCTMVSTAVGAMPSVIDHGANGLLFEPKDVEKLSEHLAFLYNNKEERKAMADALFEKAKVKYSFDAMVSDQKEIYNKVSEQKKKAAKKRDQIVICGSYGKGNAGDDAILKAVMREIEAVNPNAKICVMSRKPEQTRLRYRVRSIYTFGIFKAFCAMRRSQLYINGGGSLIQDSTSSRSLYFYLFTLVLARLAGCRVMMYGCGIGPVRKEKNKKLAGKIINKFAEFITLRDPGSLELLSEMGVTRPEVRLAADPTLGLEAASEAKIKSAFFKEGLSENEKYFCLAMRDWKGFDEKISDVAAAADYAAEKYGLTPVLIAMERKRDLPIAEKIRAAMKHDAKIIYEEHDVHTVIGILSRMQIIMAMRLHALVFGAGQGVSTIGIAYDHKVSAFMEYIGREMCAPYDGFDYKMLCEFIDRTVNDAEYGESMQKACREMRANEGENIRMLRKALGEKTENE